MRSLKGSQTPVVGILRLHHCHIHELEAEDPGQGGHSARPAATHLRRALLEDERMLWVYSIQEKSTFKLVPELRGD